MSPKVGAIASSEATSSVFHRTHMYITKQQGVGWLFLVMSIVLQAAVLAFVIVQCVNTYNELSTCKNEANVAKCPTPGAVTGIWVGLLAVTIVLVIFLVVAGLSFSYARV